MRMINRYEAAVMAAPCRPVQGSTGGVSLAEAPALRFTFRAAVRPDKQSELRRSGSVRPRERRVLLARRGLPLRQGDHLYFDGDARFWRVMQVRHHPMHTQVEAEAGE